MLKPGILALLMCMVVAAAFAPVAGAQTPAAGTPDPSASYELNFLKDMANHHAAAVVMAEKCAKEAPHAELRTFCQQIVTNQQQEIQQMVNALANWHGIAGYKPDPMAPMSDMAAMGAMTDTMSAGATPGAMGNMGNMQTPGSGMK